MSSVIYSSISKPPKILFIANTLMYLEVFEAIIVTVLIKEPILTVICTLISHIFFIELTNREPHINNILRNEYLRICEIIGFKSEGMPRFKTISLVRETGFHYEL